MLKKILVVLLIVVAIIGFLAVKFLVLNETELFSKTPTLELKLLSLTEKGWVQLWGNLTTYQFKWDFEIFPKNFNPNQWFNIKQCNFTSGQYNFDLSKTHMDRNTWNYTNRYVYMVVSEHTKNLLNR